MPAAKPPVCREEIYRSIFDKHSQSLTHIMFYKCGNTQVAEDLVQEAYIKLWKNCARVSVEKAWSYLYSVAYNAFINLTDHRKVVLRYKKSKTHRSDHITPEFLMEEKQFKQRLQQAIAELPDRQRQVFLLSRIDKKSYSEIAAIIGITEKGVEKRMSKALYLLRKKIKEL